MATEIEQLEHDAVADESRSLTFRSRGTVYVSRRLAAVPALDRAGGARRRPEGGGSPTGRRWTSASTQGLTEFLPISSSGHLILVPWLATGRTSRTTRTTTRRSTSPCTPGRWWPSSPTSRASRRYRPRLVSAVARARSGPRTSGSRWLVVATIPAAIIGGLGESDRRPARRAVADRDLPRRLRAAAWSPTAGRARARLEDRPARPLAVGIAQALALTPGVSRSGITITGPAGSGLDRDAAARFSFLLLIPVVLGAVVSRALKHVVHEALPAGSAGPFIVGMLAAASSGSSRSACSSSTSASTTTRRS